MSRLVGGRAAGVAVGLGVVLLLAGLAGCSASGGSGAATTTTSAQQAATAVLRELVRCARANGMPNMPDLRLDSNGRVSLPPGTPEPPKSVERACRSIWERLPGLGAWRRGATAGRHAGAAALCPLHARARHGGVPRPDAQGNFKAPPSLQREGKSPRLLRAMRACQQLNPNKKGGVKFRDDG